MQPLKLCATQKHSSTFGKQTRTAYNTAKLKEAKFSLSRSNENVHDRFPGNYKDSVGPSSILGRLIAANALAVY